MDLPFLSVHFTSLYFLFVLQVIPLDANLKYKGHKPLVPLSYCEYLCTVQRGNESFSDISSYDHNFERQLNEHFAKRFKRQATDAPNVVNKLTVSAGPNQTIQLPVDQAVLSSFVLPDSSTYKYSWELISPLNQEDIGNIEGLNKNQVKVSHLKAGNYTFRVTVIGENTSGSAVVSLTVLPPKISHKAPIVIIEPNAQTVQLPNKDAVLDGSSSKSSNGDPIVKYEWQAIKVPIGYKNLLSNSSILRLKDLAPGLYMFNLTVTDSQNATNSTTASVTVLKESDYPPTANAGPDIVLYLPQNEVTLNGNKSTDDKAITSWHWSRADDGLMGVDQDGTSTPYLHLSNLEVGVYKFVLQVTDSSNQISKAETHVFVKPENNEAPKANAGGNLEIVLPIKSPTFLPLDGSKSSDDIAIVKWEWKQIEGPKNLILFDANTSIARIDNIIPGKYNFSLTVWDNKNLTSTSYKMVTVIQDKNIPPKAIGGGDKTVTLPVNEVFIDGSASYDDAEIVGFKWERMANSLAFGDMIGNSSNTSVLRLTNLASGRYLFQLTVTDAHGASSSDLVSLIVKPAADILNHIEMVLNYDVQSFTYEQQTNVFRRLEVLLSEGDSVRIVSVKVDKTRERRTILIFTAKDRNNNPLQSVEVVRKIKATLRSDPNYLSIQVISVDTLVCQNNCSFHGTCDQYTKRCMCEAFWIENLVRLYFGDNQSNCEWSILYVIIISFAALMGGTVFFWVCICFISRYHHGHYSQPSRKRKIKRTNRFRYMLIDQKFDQCDNVEMVATNHHKHSQSDLSLDSDQSETLFNTIDNSNDNHRHNRANGAKQTSNNKLNAIT